MELLSALLMVRALRVDNNSSAHRSNQPISIMRSHVSLSSTLIYIMVRLTWRVSPHSESDQPSQETGRRKLFAKLIRKRTETGSIKVACVYSTVAYMISRHIHAR